MPFPIRRILLRWLQLAGAASGCCLLVWVGVQQVWRVDANDPQVQMARDAAARLASGQAPVDTIVPTATVDAASSLAPFLMVLDAQGSIVASSGRVHGALKSVPSGVLDHVRHSGEEEVSWQPEPGVRVATAVVSYPGGFVLAGRSLVESERRTARMGDLVAIAWLGMLAGLAVLVAATEAMMIRDAT
jgi:hypothetical protein